MRKPISRLRIPFRGQTPPAARDCPNCGTRVEDRFCPRCGQRNAERLVSARRLVGDALQDQLSIDGTLPQTLRLLLLRPGELTRDYLSGRIARYLPPFKLYLGSSLLFFLVLSTVAGFDRVWRGTGGATVEARMEADSGGEDEPIVNTGIDSTEVPAWLVPLARRIDRQEAKINAMPVREGARVLYEATMRDVPVVLFLMVPGFALLLKLLYRRRYYVEHFVFILHLHSVAFLLGALLLLFSPGFVVSPIAALPLAVYLLLAMWRVYREPVPRFALKYLGVILGYLASVGGVVVATVLAAILTA
jgi:hypothetical protein